MNTYRAVWKDSAVVIGITLAIAALCTPFEGHLPILLKVFVNYQSSIVGYLFLSYHYKRIILWHLTKVGFLVYAAFTPIYLLMYWNQTGTKYNLNSIIFGGLKSEAISVVVAVFLYFVFTKFMSNVINGRALKLDNIKAKPQKLKEITYLLCVFNVSGYVYIDFKSKEALNYVVVYTILMIVWYVVLWYFWHGENWARISVMVGSTISIVGLATMGKDTLPQICVDVAEAALGVFLLWWLNTKPIKEYFTKSDTNNLTPRKGPGGCV